MNFGMYLRSSGPRRIADLHLNLAEHDQSDYAGLGTFTSELAKLESEVATLETRWLELDELLN